MPLKQSIGFLGAGKMATALARGIVYAGLSRPGRITASDIGPAARKALARVCVLVVPRQPPLHVDVAPPRMPPLNLFVPVPEKIANNKKGAQWAYYFEPNILIAPKCPILACMFKKNTTR